MVTMREVAENAGVSIATVSHVINGTRFVSPEVRKRVKNVMQELGYRPNSLARSLRIGETKTIGMIVPDVSNQFFADISRQIENISFQQDYSVILCNTDNNIEKQLSYISTLLTKQVDGVVFISAGESPEHLEQLSFSQVPVVVVDRDAALAYADVVLLDNKDAGYKAARHLAELGHQQIACISGPNDLAPSMLRVEGFKKALADAGLPCKKEYMVMGDFLFSGGEKSMNTLLNQNPIPSAVFALNDMMAIGAITAIRKAGLRVPEDISVVGFDDIEMASAVSPTLTTISQPIKQMAQIAAELLIKKIKSKTLQNENQRYLLEAKLVIRESTQVWRK